MEMKDVTHSATKCLPKEGISPKAPLRRCVALLYIARKS
jgi:hypothetical protein